jgi:hypothetical protein
MLSASRHALKSDQPFLGDISGAERSAFGSMYQAITHSAIASGVLVCNLNWAGLYFDPGLGFGAGYQHNTYGDGRGGPNVGFKTLILLRTGYVTRWFDFGAMVQNDRTAWDVNPDEVLGYESFLGRLYLEVFFFWQGGEGCFGAFLRRDPVGRCDGRHRNSSRDAFVGHFHVTIVTPRFSESQYLLGFKGRPYESFQFNNQRSGFQRSAAPCRFSNADE